jgi:hypothetical protein
MQSVENVGNRFSRAGVRERLPEFPRPLTLSLGFGFLDSVS